MSSIASFLLPLLFACFVLQPVATISLKEVVIGDQIWMSVNLDTDTFSNGDHIPQVVNDYQWIEANEKGEPAWCYYSVDDADPKTYGKLYNWYAVNDPRGLAPKGWRIPSDADWLQLEQFCGGKKKAGLVLKSSSGWNKNGNGTQSNGFDAVPSGMRSKYEPCSDAGDIAYYWSSESYNEKQAFCRHLYYNNTMLGKDFMQKSAGISVRCVKNK